MEKNEKTTHLPFFGIGRLLPYLGHVKKILTVMVILALMSSVMDVIMPMFQRYALDNFVRGGTMDTVVGFVALYIGALLFSATVNYISCAQAIIVEMRVNQELRRRGFEHLQTLSFSYFNQNSVGYIPDCSRISTRIKSNLDENQIEFRRESNRISARIKSNLDENQIESRRELL